MYADRERRYAFWHASSWLLEQSQSEENRANLFCGTDITYVPLGRRLSGPETLGPLVWLSGGSTLTRVSGGSWYARFHRYYSGGYDASFYQTSCPNPYRRRSRPSSDRATASLLGGSSDFWNFHLLVGGNTNAISWMATGKARKGAWLQLLKPILAYLQKNKMGGAGSVRSHISQCDWRYVSQSQVGRHQPVGRKREF